MTRSHAALARAVEAGNPAAFDDYFAANMNYGVTNLPLAPDTWLLVTDTALRAKAGKPSDHHLYCQLLIELWQGMPEPASFPESRQPHLTDTLCQLARDQPDSLAWLLKGQLGSASEQLILACMAVHGPALWRLVLRFHCPFLGRSLFYLPKVREAAAHYYQEYITDRSRRAAEGSVERLPHHHYFEAGIHAAHRVYFAAVFLPYLLAESPKAKHLAKLYPGWDTAHQLIPWLANGDARAKPGDPRCSPEIQQTLHTLYQWPLQGRVQPLWGILSAPQWVLSNTGPFDWSPRHLHVGASHLVITPTTIGSPRSKLGCFRLGPCLGIAQLPARLTPKHRQTLRILRAQGLHVLRPREPGRGRASVDPAKTLLRYHVAAVVAHGLTCDTLNLPSELDPGYHKTYCKALLPVIQLLEGSMVGGDLPYDADWHTVVTRYLPDYIPAPEMTALMIRHSAGTA